MVVKQGFPDRLRQLCILLLSLASVFVPEALVSVFPKQNIFKWFKDQIFFSLIHNL